MDTTFEAHQTQLKEYERNAQFGKLLDGAKHLLSAYQESALGKAIAAGYLIDAGNIQADLAAVEEGVAVFEALVDSPFADDEGMRVQLLYNLANGYDSLSRLSQNIDEEAAAEYLQKSKGHMQSMLVRPRSLPLKILPSALTNYANTLDRLGRSLEAVDEYIDCLQKYPRHAMAMGNCGITVMRLIGVTGAHDTKNVYLAWTLLSQACELRDEVLDYGSPAALEFFHARRDLLERKIEAHFSNGLDGLLRYIGHRNEVHEQPEAPAWLEKINNDRLLLTLNLMPLNSLDECVDDLFFENVITGISKDEERWFFSLVNMFNLIKEEYATARYLYYYSDEAKEEFAPRSRITTYGNALDYADFGVGSGLLKASFRTAADCLDKVAVFVNQYLRLGESDDQVSFTNVWYEKLQPKKGGLHKTIASTAPDNFFLAALLDMKRDWYLQSLPAGQLKDIRNWATHNRLFLHYWRTPEDVPESWDIEDFRSATKFMLRFTKAAILYLAGLVAVEEQRRSSASNRPTAPMFFNLESGLSDRFFDSED